MKTLKHISRTAHKVIACLLAFCIVNIPVFAIQNGDVIDATNASVSITDNVLTNVELSGSKAILNWSNLDTIAGETLRFSYDGGKFAALNNIFSNAGTTFGGHLDALGGLVIFVDQHGIVFTGSATISADQFIASTLRIDSTDFMNGIYKFSGDGIGEIENYGDITAEQVALLGKRVLNAGTIRSPGGYTIMAAGDSVYLGSEGSDVVVEVAGVTVPDGAAGNGLGDVVNEGTIEAPNGGVIMAAGDTYARAINGLDTLTVAVGSGVGRVGQFGTVTADGTDGDGGSVTLTAADMVVLGNESITTANAGANGDGGQVIAYSPDTTILSENAAIEAKGGQSSGDGGFVEVSGKEYVEIWGQVSTSAAAGENGQFLIDPTNIIIRTPDQGPMVWDQLTPTSGAFHQDESSSEYQNVLSPFRLVSYLADNDVIVSTYEGGPDAATGWIEVWEPISWDSDTALTFLSNGYIKIGVKNPDGSITDGSIIGDGDFSAYTDGVDHSGSIHVYSDIEAKSITLEAGNPDEITNARSNLSIYDSATLTARTGNIDLSAREHIKIDGDVNAELGNIQINADSERLGRGNVIANGQISTGADETVGGNVDITGRTVVVNRVHADGDLTITGMEPIEELPIVYPDTYENEDIGMGGKVDAKGLLTADGDIELGVKKTDPVFNPEWNEDVYPESDDYDLADGLIYIGNDVDALGNVTFHNNTEFYGDGDQTVLAGAGITADGYLIKEGAPVQLAIASVQNGSGSGNLYLEAEDDISLADDVINYENGGVRIWSHGGKIFTPGSDALNVHIEGWSDYWYNQGVDLPFGDGKAAIVLLSHDTMELGPNASLHAEGYFMSTDEAVSFIEPGIDDRPGAALLQEDGAIIGGHERDEGFPGDIAIYVGSTAEDVIVNTSDIQIVNRFNGGGIIPFSEPAIQPMILQEPSIQQEGTHTATLVLDAYDTVQFPGILELLGELDGRVEAVSRVCEWLFQAVEGNKLPLAGDSEIRAALGNSYVMRGSGRNNSAIVAEENSDRAWVLENPPVENLAAPLEELAIPETKGCPVEMDAAAAELAINTEDLQLLFNNSLAFNPNLQPCEACQQLITSAKILDDPTGERLAAMNQVFNTLAPADAPFTPEVQANITTAFANLSDEDMQYALASEYVNAFVDYVAVVGTELQAPVGDPVIYALEKYGQEVADVNPNITAYMVAQATGGNL